MDMKEICPCVNLECPNHGNCEKCISRHLRIGSLNFCSYYTVLPALQEAIDASPESPTAKKLAALIANRSETYNKLMEKHGISREDNEGLLKKVTDFSDY
jgi:hypothetical protein